MVEKKIIEDGYSFIEDYSTIRERLLEVITCPKCESYAHYAGVEFIRKGFLFTKEVEIKTFKCDCGCKYSVENAW